MLLIQSMSLQTFIEYFVRAKKMEMKMEINISYNISTAPFEIQNVQKFQNRMALFEKKNGCSLQLETRRKRKTKKHT